MSKEIRATSTPPYRPQNNSVVKIPHSTTPAISTKPSSSQSSFRQLSPASTDINEQNAVDPIEKTSSTPAASNRALPDSAGVDTQRLQDRITACLALQASASSEWAIAMPLRSDLAPLSRFRLESDRNGEITLKLFSELPVVVEALQAQVPALTTALISWSAGVPKVEVTLSPSVQRL